MAPHSTGRPRCWPAGAQILVPLLPSNHSLMQLRATERFLNGCHEEDPSPHLRYVLNHFDEQDAHHKAMRDRFQQRLGVKLLRGSMRRSSLVDEALACGKTVVDHAPTSPLVDDLKQVAQQLHQLDMADVCASTPCEWFEH